jgi:hypothetical protein
MEIMVRRLVFSAVSIVVCGVFFSTLADSNFSLPEKANFSISDNFSYDNPEFDFFITDDTTSILDGEINTFLFLPVFIFLGILVVKYFVSVFDFFKLNQSRAPPLI